MTSFWALPLRRQLLLANLLLFLGPVLVLAIWSSAVSVRDRESQLRSQAQTVATTTVAYIDRDLHYLDSMAQEIAAMPEVQTLDSDKTSATLQNVILARPAIVGIVVTADGRTFGRAVRKREQLADPTWVSVML